MATILDINEKVNSLRSELIDVMERFSIANPDMPAQAVMAGLGELLIQFSMSQVGAASTQTFLGHLNEAVRVFEERIAPQH